MPLTEIDVTRPTIHENYWKQRDAGAGGQAAAAALARGRSRPFGGGPSQAARLPAAGLPRPVAGVGEGRRALGGLVGGLHRAGPAGVRRRPVRPGRVGAHHRGLERARDPVAGAGRRPVDAARRRRSNGCADRSARSSACWRARAGRRLSCPMPRCRRWRRPWPSGGRACCCGATSRPPGWPGSAARAGATRASAGPFLDTWGAIGLPWGRDKTAVSIVGSLDPERLDVALEGPATALPRASSMPGPAPRPTARCAP